MHWFEYPEGVVKIGHEGFDFPSITKRYGIASSSKITAWPRDW
ncbi:MAG: hypothetical protein U1F57_07215 [bacterium]